MIQRTQARVGRTVSAHGGGVKLLRIAGEKKKEYGNP